MNQNLTPPSLPTEDHDYRKQFEQIFELYYNNVIHYAFYYLNDYEKARDVAQDVFFAVWKNIDEVEQVTFSWILTIAKNKCLNVLRSESHHLKYTTTTLSQQKKREINLYTLENSQVESLMETSEISRIMCQALDKMPQKTKEAFLLNRFENKSYTEIAEIQQVSRKNIEYRIMYALKILRKSLADFIVIILGII